MDTNKWLTEGARSLWEKQLFCDYTINVEHDTFTVHRLVMVSASDYFKVMLSGDMLEGQADSVKLQDISPLVVGNLVNFIYTEEFGSPRAGAKELLAGAAYLQIPRAVEACTRLLLREMRDKNCLDILTAFKDAGAVRGIKETEMYINANITNILKICVPDELTHDNLVNVMDFWPQSEWELLETVLAWVHIDFDNRKDHINNLMYKIRFCLMTPTQLVALKILPVYRDFEGDWRDLVAKAEKYHTLPMHQQVLHDEDQSRVRGNPTPIYYCSYTSGKNKLLVSNKGNKCSECETHSSPHFDDVVYYVYSINNFLLIYYCPDDLAEMTWHIFNPRTQVWSTLAQMGKQREYCDFCVYKTDLYALGGTIGEKEELTDSIEMYDFHTNTWSMLNITLPVALRGHTVEVIDDHMYIVDEANTCKATASLRMDCLDMINGTCLSKSPLPKLHDYAVNVGIMNLWDEKALVCLVDNLMLCWYNCKADQWSILDCHSYVGTQLVSSGNPQFQDNSIYLFNDNYKRKGSNEEKQCTCVEWRFDAQSKKIVEVDWGMYSVMEKSDEEDEEEEDDEENEADTYIGNISAVITLPGYMIKD